MDGWNHGGAGADQFGGRHGHLCRGVACRACPDAAPTCIGGEFDETLEMTLPRFVRVTDLPTDTAVKNRFIEFSSRYVFDPAARVLQVRRHLRAVFGHQMCSANEFAEMKDDLVRIERDLDTALVLKVAG